MFNPFSWIASMFQKVQNTLPNFLKNSLTQATQLLLSLSTASAKELVPQIIEIVKGLANSPASGADKMNSALTQLTELLKKKGITIAESVGRLLLELAVAYIKSLK